MRVNLNQLNVFYLVARQRSMADAAKVLYVSAPAVTMQIKKLENWLGFPVFERVRGSLSLTERGQSLYAALDPVFSKLDELEHYLQHTVQTEEIEIRFGFYHIAGVYFVPDLTAHIRARFPRLKVKMEMGTMDELLEMLAQQKLDIILIIGEPPQNMKFRQEHVFDHEVALVTGAQSEYAQITSIPVKEVAKIPLLLQLKGTGSRLAVLEYLEKHAVEPNILVDGISSDVIKQFLLQMPACSFIGRYIVRKELEEGLLHEIQIPEGLPVCRFHLVYLNSPHIPMKVRDFIAGAANFSPNTGT